MRISKMSAANSSIIDLIIKLLNENQFRGTSDWSFSHSIWRDSSQQLAYADAGTRQKGIRWIGILTLVNDYITWQEDPIRAMNFLSDPDNKARYIGHMLCKHILEHGSILCQQRKSKSLS